MNGPIKKTIHTELYSDKAYSIILGFYYGLDDWGSKQMARNSGYCDVERAPDNEVVLTIGKDDLKNAFSLFNGTFRQELWKWETVTIDASKEYLDKGQIKVEHSDLTAECETFIPVSVSSNTADDLINFIISSSCISDFLNLVDGNSVSISMNGLALNEIHGPGIKIFSDSIEAICCKIAEADN